MRALLDTHVFLWWIMDSARLPQQIRQTITDGRNEILVSAATGWEIAIKARLGRLDLPDSPARFVSKQLAENDFSVLAVQMSHALQVYRLPDYHRDPFDRLLVAQAQLDNLVLLTVDSEIAQYDVRVIGPG